MLGACWYQLVPYLSNGPVHLKSNVNLHLAEGASIRFGTDPADYTPLVKVRWEGTVAYNYSPLVCAYRQESIAVTGRGILDGQTEGRWPRELNAVGIGSEMSGGVRNVFVEDCVLRDGKHALNFAGRRSKSD